MTYPKPDKYSICNSVRRSAPEGLMIHIMSYNTMSVCLQSPSFSGSLPHSICLLTSPHAHTEIGCGLRDCSKKSTYQSTHSIEYICKIKEIYQYIKVYYFIYVGYLNCSNAIVITLGFRSSDNTHSTNIYKLVKFI